MDADRRQHMKKKFFWLSLLLLFSFAVYAQEAQSPKETLEKIFNQPVIQQGDKFRLEFPRTDIGKGLVSWIEFTPKHGAFLCTGDLVLLKKEVMPVKLNFANTYGFRNIVSSGGEIQHLTFEAQGDLSRIANDIQIILYYDTNTPMGSRK
jgi:hypothetical protein